MTLFAVELRFISRCFVLCMIWKIALPLSYIISITFITPSLDLPLTNPKTYAQGTNPQPFIGGNCPFQKPTNRVTFQKQLPIGLNHGELAPASMG